MFSRLLRAAARSGRPGLAPAAVAGPALASSRLLVTTASAATGTAAGHPGPALTTGSCLASALVFGAILAASGGAAYAAERVVRERTYIMVKPDGVQRGLVAEVIRRFEARGYKLVAIKVLVPSKALAAQHYGEHKDRPFFPKLVTSLSGGAVVGMVWEGNGVIAAGRAMIGATNPLQSAPGTIRGDLAIDTGRNVIHGSDGVVSAQAEIALWFQPEEIADYTLSAERHTHE